MEKSELLTAALNALDRLLKMFLIERYLYLCLTAISFVILLYAAYRLVIHDVTNTEVLLGIFGSSGLIAASSARLSWFFNKAFALIEDLIRGFSR
jgi:hypothetical protein